MNLKNKLDKYYDIRIKYESIIVKSKTNGKEASFRLSDRYIYLGNGNLVNGMSNADKEKAIGQGLLIKIHLKDLYMMYSNKDEEEVKALMYRCDSYSLEFINELKRECGLLSINKYDEKIIKDDCLIGEIQGNERVSKLYKPYDDLYVVEREIEYGCGTIMYLIFCFNHKPSKEDFTLAEKIYDIKYLFKAGRRAIFNCVECSTDYHWLMYSESSSLNEKIKMLRDSLCIECVKLAD